MRKIWVISDTHFNHKNILNFKNDADVKTRPEFNDLDHMNEIIIDNWNNTVHPDDIVYHLGDVYFGSNEKADLILKRLNGAKRLILGNHDDPKAKPILNNFQKIMLWRHFQLDGKRIILSHMPLHPSAFGKYEYNFHGHIHQNESPSKAHINVCVEKTNYTPVLLTDLIKKLK